MSTQISALSTELTTRGLRAGTVPLSFAAATTPARLLRLRAKWQPDEQAVVQRRADSEQTWTWRDLDALVSSAVALLADHGVRPGDTVAVVSRSSVEVLATVIAAQALGCLTYGVHPDTDLQTWADTFRDTAPAFVLAEGMGRLEQVREVVEREDAWSATVCTTRERHRAAVWWEDSIRNVGGMESSRDQWPRDLDHSAAAARRPSWMFYTSGTTGRPKGVQLTWSGLIHSWCGPHADGMGALPVPGLADRTLHEAPLSSTTSVWLGVIYPLIYGCTATIPDHDADPHAERAALAPTIAYIRPNMWAEIAKDLTESAAQADGPAAEALRAALAAGAWQHDVERSPADQDEHARLRAQSSAERTRRLSDFGLQHADQMYCAGAPLNSAVIERLTKFGIDVVEFYGSTECSGLAAVRVRSASRQHGGFTPTPYAEMSVDGDGEILIRGPLVFSRYYHSEGPPDPVDDQGWLHTGDLGHRQGDGDFLVTDRVSNLVVLNDGRRISPASIEQAVLQEQGLRRVVCVGDQREEVRVLIEPIPEWWSATPSAALTYEETIRSPQVIAAVGAALARANDRLESDGLDRIAGFAFLPEPVDPFDVTIVTVTSKKLRRRPLLERYEDLIDELYRGGLMTQTGRRA